MSQNAPSRWCLILMGPVLWTAVAQNTQAQRVPSAKQLQGWLKRFPDADTNQDGKLSLDEALRFRSQMRGGDNPGAPREFRVDPGWKADRFPDHAVCYQSPAQIKAIYQETLGKKQPSVVSYEPPTDGALRIVGTGHSFMAPGYKTMPIICKAAGMDQPLYTHTGGGITGSTRYKWEQENGIFGFDGRPTPKLLASIANADWDAMMWGPYFNDEPEYYSCWVDFCLKYHPDMRFFLSDAWPQLYQLKQLPASESEMTADVFEKMGRERREEYAKQVSVLLAKYPDKIFVMPTSNAMVLAAKAFLKDDLPGIDGLHRVVGKKERSLWRDQLGHLGPGFEWLEGYVFYATLYRKSPELLPTELIQNRQDGFPSPELDQKFREIAWQAVISHPLSGVTDADGDGQGD
ncbi:MAG: hypothetical protein AAGD07_19865 [Planctomycetota bacterium]